VTAAQPNDVLLQLLLANAAYQSSNNPVALRAYRRVIKLAPGSSEAQQARQQIQFIKAQPSTG
jgi:cytochrome c-type biogenesis protein CcmH/NrfG